MLTFALVSSKVQKCAFHTLGVPVINDGDVEGNAFL